MALNPNINANRIEGNLSLSGTAYATSISASTIFSGSTNLYNIFSVANINPFFNNLNASGTSTFNNVIATNSISTNFASITSIDSTIISANTVSLFASTTSDPSFRIVAGVAPTSPHNGDIWFDGTNLKMRVGGATKTFTLT